MQKSLIVVLITGLIVAIFAVLNAAPVTINVIFAKFTLSQAIVILVSVIFGALAMFMLNAFQVMKLKKQVKQLSKKLIDAEAKLADQCAKQTVAETAAKKAPPQQTASAESAEQQTTFVEVSSAKPGARDEHDSQ